MRKLQVLFIIAIRELYIPRSTPVNYWLIGWEVHWSMAVVEIDAVAIFEEVIERVSNDPATKKLSEEYQLLYGTLDDNDLKKIYTL